MTDTRELIKRCIPRGLLETYQMRKYGRFLWMKLQTGGLLGPDVYEEIYQAFLGAAPGGGDIVEVGGASGSASIAIAWALQDAGGEARLVVVEKFEGGTRAQFGGYDENLNRFQSFIRRYRVAGRITLFPDYLTMANGGQVLDLVSTPQIGGLMLDADGHIHRDFAIFWPRLSQNAPIIIDDYNPDISPKHEMTYRLLNRFIDWGLVERKQVIGGTFFGTRGTASDISRLDFDECEAIAKEVCERHRVRFDRSGIVLNS